MVDTSLFLWPASGFEAEPEGWWAGLFCMGAWLWVREIEWVGRDWISSWACWWRKHPPCNIFHPAYRHTTIQNNISNNIIFLLSLFINWTHPCLIIINFFQKKTFVPVSWSSWCVSISPAILKRRRLMGSLYTDAPAMPSIQDKKADKTQIKGSNAMWSFEMTV